VGCLAAAERVDRITLPRFAGEREFERVRAQAWRNVAYARAADPAGCLTAAEQVERIALPRFAGARELEFERAAAWRAVAYARLADPAGCLAAAERVDGIVAASERSDGTVAPDAEMQVERAWAHRHCAIAHRREPATFERHVATVREIVARFPGHPRLVNVLEGL
jgi:hypothetical protein